MESIRQQATLPVDWETIEHWFFVGIGGMGMAPLALFLAARGGKVSGSDRQIPEVLRRHFARAGIILCGESEDLPPDCQGVVHTSAVKEGHPVLGQARNKELPVFRRGHLLAEVARRYRLLAVVGAHGKTTTSILLAEALARGTMPYQAILGGLFQDEKRAPAHFDQQAEWLIAEVDESDGTIDGFAPEITLVVNLDWDHCDRYTEESRLFETFAALFQRTTGTVLIPSTCPRCQAVVESLPPGGPKIKTFGPNGDWPATVRQTDAWSMVLETPQGSATVALPGKFNGWNAAAASAGLREMGFPWTPDAWVNCRGIKRRQEVLWRDAEMMVMQDYAHHPAEIDALLEWAGEAFQEEGRQRMVVVFQSHRYSRTKQFAGEFARSLAEADLIFVLETYAASETWQQGGDAADLVAAINRHRPGVPAEAINDPEQAVATILGRLQVGDGVLFIGAGDIEQTARELVRSYAGQRSVRWWDGLVRDWPESSRTVLRSHEELARKTTLRVGGPARFYAEPADEEDLRKLLVEAAEVKVPVFVLGRGSNLIIPEDGFGGLVVRLQGDYWRHLEAEGPARLRVRAGVRLRQLCGEACKLGWSGLEFLEGIPGTLGGALRMNAGAMGGWTFDVIEKIRYMTLDGEIREVAKADLHVGYRHCRELEKGIALEAILVAPGQSESDAIRSQLKAYMEKRTASQPKEPSAGCIFKNPEGDSAGRLIDVLGLKGWREGSAEVSSVHGNFIINRGGASAGDVLQLVRRVRQEVKNRTGITLEPEVLLPGHDWEDLL